ncbi:hypothetical protein DQ04_14381020 [Trypanosoma grayi]|uniref:hypothetical protein n=1 Tax=Trypanosoma grayi TaxID=71804 RepID=UPI0004F46062|nr:hypothetical protein DQ04_14381020 [Trypanosoma grayi]KEG06367.1 hypothetical protein DQ04_14381020 [Trypanosoma grayi]
MAHIVAVLIYGCVILIVFRQRISVVLITMSVIVTIIIISSPIPGMSQRLVRQLLLDDIVHRGGQVHLIATGEDNTPVTHHNDVVGTRQHVQLVCRQHACLACEDAEQHVRHDALADVGVQRGERVVQQVQLAVGVHRTGEAHACLLPAAQVDALLANLCLHPACQQLQVCLQLAHAHHLAQPLRVLRGEEEHIVAQRCIHDPRLLRYVRHVAGGPHVTVRHLVLAQQRPQQCRLAAARWTEYDSELPLRHLEGNPF